VRGLPREKALATVVHLLETTFIRVGNDDYARQNNTYGLTTLKSRHAAIDGNYQ
jgi:DNA topoisomerase I